jgi:hypothetical protein
MSSSVSSFDRPKNDPKEPVGVAFFCSASPLRGCMLRSGLINLAWLGDQLTLAGYSAAADSLAGGSTAGLRGMPDDDWYTAKVVYPDGAKVSPWTPSPFVAAPAVRLGCCWEDGMRIESTSLLWIPVRFAGRGMSCQLAYTSVHFLRFNNVRNDSIPANVHIPMNW